MKVVQMVVLTVVHFGYLDLDSGGVALKRFILLFIGIIIIGSLAIAMPYFLAEHKERKEVIQVKENKKELEELSSNIDTIDDAELSTSQIETEIYNESQMYFENIDKLYKVATFNQVEDIKQKIQFYIHNNINKGILDCTLLADSVRHVDNKIVFSLSMDSIKNLTVEVTKDSNNNIIDITIFHEL